MRSLRLRGRSLFSEETFHILLAAIVGVLGGLVNLLFHHAVATAQFLVLRKVGDPGEIAGTLEPLPRIVVPTVGAGIAGLILYSGYRLLNEKGTTNLLEVVVAGDGRLPLRMALVNFLSSLVTMASGGSIGREGGIVHLSATLASALGRIAKWPPYRLRMLVGCGAAAGIAAAYGAPVSGAIFAAWIVFGNFSMNLFAPIVCASVIATAVSRTFFGIQPWYTVPPFEFSGPAQLPWFVPLGLVCGLFGAGFLKSLRASESAFRSLPIPIYLRLAVGGLIVGLIALKFPGVWGNGYYETNRILLDAAKDVTPSGAPGMGLILFLASLVAAKWVATLATVGSGAVGGVFTPTLFLGAGLGAAFGLSLQQMGWALDLPVTAFTLVGMGSLLSATTRSPLLAIVMIFEISLDYSIMLPLMLTCVVATLVANRLHTESVYTEPLRRKGLARGIESAQVGASLEKTVGDLMGEAVVPVREDATLREIAMRFLGLANNRLPVTDAEGRLKGMISIHEFKALFGDDLDSSPLRARDIMRPPAAVVTPDQRLVDILPVVIAAEHRNIPVVNTRREMRLIGLLPKAGVLEIFSEAISKSVARG